MSRSQYNILNRFFSREVLLDLFNNGKNVVYQNCVNRFFKNQNPFQKRNQEIIEFLYLQCDQYYRNEYFYKNTLINRLFLEKQNIHTTIALNEIPINQSVADLILVNGKAILYEIKSNIDNLDRLNNQILNYYTAIDTIYVVTYDGNQEKIEKAIQNDNVGIYILTNDNELIEQKTAVPNSSNLQNESIFKLLRKSEYTNILLGEFGKLPSSSQIMFYRDCLNLVNKIDTDKFYKLTTNELKKRNILNPEEYQISIPYELKFPLYFANLKKIDFSRVNCFLNSNYGG